MDYSGVFLLFCGRVVNIEFWGCRLFNVLENRFVWDIGILDLKFFVERYLLVVLYIWVEGEFFEGFVEVWVFDVYGGWVYVCVCKYFRVFFGEVNRLYNRLYFYYSGFGFLRGRFCFVL